MLTGLSHLTLAVSSLERSLVFYQHYLGMQCHASWETGAYLSCGELWLCLSYDSQAGARSRDYTHYAFSIDEADFSNRVRQLKAAGVICWKDNHSEGQSFYFLDPDNHQLELHVGSLASRLEACREKPYQQMVFYPEVRAANDDNLGPFHHKIITITGRVRMFVAVATSSYWSADIPVCRHELC